MTDKPITDEEWAAEEAEVRAMLEGHYCGPCGWQGGRDETRDRRLCPECGGTLIPGDYEFGPCLDCELR
jgi:predicted RNA-binding Zn-ribbon protein involved in translation (DUF1610 family)